MPDDREFIIRSPQPAERRACRMLLPRATEAGEQSRVFVAATVAPVSVVVGAAALGPDLKYDGQRWNVDLHVIPPFRRRGIARELLHRVLEDARSLGLQSLRAREWTDPESDAARAWAALGFSICQRRSDFRVELTRALEILAPLLERVRDRIPPGARVISLGEADLDQVMRLHEQFLGGNPRVLRPLLTGLPPNGYDLRMSSVLTLDGQAVGLTLGRVFNDGTCEVDARVLHPSVRRRWANVFIMHEAFRRIYAEGTRVMRYFTLDAHDDTRQLGERLGGELTATSVQMGLDLAPQAGQANRTGAHDGVEG